MAVDIKHRFMVLRVIHILLEQNRKTRRRKTNSVTEDPQAEAQVIVNQATKSYIVGPLSVTYPYYEDISYVKAIYLVTDKGTDNEKTLVYDENTNDFEIEFIGATVSGSNGLKRNILHQMLNST